MYRRELEQQCAKVTEMRSSNSCPHELAKQSEVADETHNMITECETRLATALQDLADMLVPDLFPHPLKPSRVVIPRKTLRWEYTMRLSSSYLHE